MADIGRASMPSQNVGFANENNSVLQGSKQEFSNLSCKTQESDHQYNRRDHCRFVPRRSSRDRRDETRYPKIRDRDKIHLLRSSDGHVPRRSTSFLIKHSLPQIHPKASVGVSQGISSKMIEVQSFKHVLNPTETNPMENIVGDSFSLLMG